MKPEDLTGEARERFDTWRRLGMSEASSMRQLEADGLVPVDGFDQFASALSRLGASESAARNAAVGRHRGEGEARRLFDEGSRAGQVETLAAELKHLAEGVYAQYGVTKAASMAINHARAKAGDAAMRLLVDEATVRAFGAAVTS